MINKQIYFLFLTFLTINIVLRYPITPHEVGADSFYIHMLSNSIVSEGKILWFLDLFSLFGAFPFSYPSGIPVYLGCLKLVTNLNIEMSILVMNLSFGTLSFIGAFTFSRFYFGTCSSLTLSLLYSTSQGTLEFTTWSAVGRALYICFIPILLFLMYSSINFNNLVKNRRINIKYIILLIILLLIFMSSHRIAYSVIFCVISFIFVILFYFFFRKIFFYSNYLKITFNIVYLLILLFSFTYYFLPISNGQARIFLDSEDFEKGPIHWLILTISSNTRYTGPIIIFAPIGLLYFLGFNKKLQSYHLLFYLLIISLLAIDVTYSKSILLLFNVFFGFLGLIFVRDNLVKESFKKTFYVMIIIICLIFSTFFQLYNPNFSASHLNLSNNSSTSLERHMDEESYNFAIYLKNSKEDGFIGNEIGFSNRIAAISEVPIFGTTGPTEITNKFKDPNQLILERNNIFSYNSWDEGLIKNTYRSDYDMYSDYVRILNRNYLSSEDKLFEKRITLAIENKKVYDFVEEKPFSLSISDSKYKIYEDSRSTSRYIG